MVVKIKQVGSKREYYPYRIPKFSQYRDKLRILLNENPNLNFIGVMEIPTKKIGIKVFGKDSHNISDISLFYSLADINYFFYQSRESSE